jgi:tripartite ATP-independent transporter DctM subunit
MNSLYLFVILMVFILLGAPIGFVMVILPTIYIMITDAMPLSVIPYQMFNSVAHSALVAIPFFLLTGELMNHGKITDRLVDLSRELVGRIRGGLAQVNVLISMIFAGMNGSAIADSAVVGSLIIPAMQRAGYSGPFSAALTAVSSTIGGIIPPSIIMILVASNLNLSVGAMFSAGIIPGLLVGIALMILCYAYAVVRNYERYEVPFTWRALGRAFRRSGLALLIPAILVGGIASGIWGTIEAGAITATTAFIIGKVVYRTLSWEEFFAAVTRAVVTTSSVFIIIAAAGPFGWFLSRLGALNFVEDWLLSFVESPILFVVVVVAFMIFVGMIMAVLANIIVLGPTLVHVLVEGGYHEYQAALVVTVGLLMGVVTPPVGVAYFTVAAIAREKLEPVAWALIPFILTEVGVLFLMLAFAPITLFLPQWFGFIN